MSAIIKAPKIGESTVIKPVIKETAQEDPPIISTTVIKPVIKETNK